MKNPALTGIRGLAALWVVAFHAYEAMQSVAPFPPRDEIPIVRSGYLGVDLFFLLSGFILALTYAGPMSPLRWPAVRRFLIGRVCRILPLHWFMLAVLGLAVTLAPAAYWGPGPFTARSFAASALLVQGWIGMPIAWNAPTWSLSAEWLSYLFFIVLIGFASWVRTRKVACLAYAACLLPLAAILLAVHSSTLDHAERLGLIRCLCEFSAGSMLCRLVQVGIRSGTALFWLGLGCLAVAVTFRSVEVLAVPGFSCLIVSSAVLSGPTLVLFGNRYVVFLGEISYSIYLTHLTLINLGLAIGRIGGFPHPLPVVAFCTISVIPVSWMTWRFIEIPCQALGRGKPTRVVVVEAGR